MCAKQTRTVGVAVGKRAEKHSPKMMTATSTEQRTPSSYAFLKRPFLRWSCVRRWAQSVIERVLMDAKRIDIFIATDL